MMTLASTRNASPSVARPSEVSVRSMTTLTRCSSTPKAETFVNPEGSTSRAPHQRPLAAPVLQQDFVAWRDLNGVARQDVDHGFQVFRVAEFHNLRAGLHHGGALLKHSQHAAVDRRMDVEPPALLARLLARKRTNQRGSGLFPFEISDLQGELGRPQVLPSAR